MHNINKRNISLSSNKFAIMNNHKEFIILTFSEYIDCLLDKLHILTRCNYI